MLMVEPSASRFEETGLSGSTEEHLLERVSTLENKLARLTDKLEQSLDIVLQQARNSYSDHTLLETLIGILSDSGVVPRASLDTVWRQRCENEVTKRLATLKLTALRAAVLSRWKGNERGQFEQQFERGLNLITAGKRRSGVRTLEKVAVQASDNGPLLTFLGACFFEDGKSEIAISYLDRAFVIDAASARVNLMLGVLNGEKGDISAAETFLRRAVSLGCDSFSAHFALARISLAQGRHDEAVTAFLKAASGDHASICYLAIADVYYRQKRDRLCERYVQKALDLNKDSAEAHYFSGVLRLRQGDSLAAAKAFESAFFLRPGDPRFGDAAIRLIANPGPLVPSPIFNHPKGRKRLITGGDSDLLALLTRDAVEFTG
jgi:tetratricopeptide (TPR) repeat protein